VNKHNNEAHACFITRLFIFWHICVYIPPSGVHTFLLLPVTRISLYINSLNDQFEQHKLFDFVFKADVIKQFLKKRLALLQSVKLTRSAY